METWNPEKAASWNRAPKLHYCLDYDRQKAELFVTCLEGKLSVDFWGLLYFLSPGGAVRVRQEPPKLGARGVLCGRQTRKHVMLRHVGLLSLSRKRVQSGGSRWASVLPPNGNSGARLLPSVAP